MLFQIMVKQQKSYMYIYKNTLLTMIFSQSFAIRPSRFGLTNWKAGTQTAATT